MAKKKLYKSKTNFTLRRLHQSGSYGKIFERDYTTISNTGASPEGQIPIYNSPSFKFTIRAGYNGQKLYKYGNWLTHNACSTEGSKLWTLNCMPVLNINDSKIILKPNSKRLTDFVCYGSATELIRASLTNIISNYPAELYFTENILSNTGLLVTNNNIPEDSELKKKTGDEYDYKDYIIIDNPLLIDITQKSLSEKTIFNVLRYFCKSYEKYEIIYKDWEIINKVDVDNETNLPKVKKEIKDKSIYYIKDKDKYCVYRNNEWVDIVIKQVETLSNIKIVESNCIYYAEDEKVYYTQKQKITNWIINSDESYDNCLVNGQLLARININTDINEEIIILCFYYEDNIIYLSNNKNVLSIRPIQNEIDNFFNNLSDFEKVLLNQYTNYTAKFETYVEDEENGWKIINKNYQWPKTKGGWNLSVNGMKYTEYSDDLYKLASACDELYSNAIWRDMTHEAIKNLDLTLYKNGELVDFGLSSKMQKTLNIVGRQFDEIKKYVDNIKYSNNISYTQENNTPDYFLTDNLELSGWETKEILNDISNDDIVENFYNKECKGYTASDANNEFLRRLFLNSNNIFSKKGTKQAIEDLMGVFGFHSQDWYDKYIKYHYNGGKINDTIGVTDNDKEELEKIKNKLFTIKEYVYIVNGYNKGITVNEITDKVTEINMYKKSFNLDDINGEKEINKYYGLPLAEIEIEGQKRLIPWFDKTQEYDGKLFFQMDGGWSKYGGRYDKTVSNIHYVNDKSELEDLPYYTRDENALYYVGSEDLYYQYVSKDWVELKCINVTKLPENNIKLNSIYYIASDKKYYIHENNNWVELQLIEVNTTDELPSGNDIKLDSICYLKSDKKYYIHREWINVDDEKIIKSFTDIIDNNKGNNPHNGNYDDGEKYKRPYGEFFCYSEFDENVPNDITKDKEKYGFNIEKVEDTLKCHYFSNQDNCFEYWGSDSILRTHTPHKHYTFDINVSDIFVPTTMVSIKTKNDLPSVNVINEESIYIIEDKNKYYIHENNNWVELQLIEVNTTDELPSGNDIKLDSIYYVEDEKKYYIYENNGWVETIPSNINIDTLYYNKVKDKYYKYYENYNWVEYNGVELVLIYYVEDEKKYYIYENNGWVETIPSNIIDVNSESDLPSGNGVESDSIYYVEDEKKYYIYKNNKWVETKLNNIIYYKVSEKKYYKFEKDFKTINELNSLRVINNKILEIIFPEKHKDIITNDVLPYLKQIIPSTSIFEYSFK